MDENFSPEQMKENLIAEARSIQGLLAEYKQSQDALQKDVNEFINRDTKEEYQKQKLYDKVELAEAELMSNIDYLKFGKKFSSTHCVIPTRRMRESNGNIQVRSPQKMQSMGKICELKDEFGGISPCNGVQLRDFSDLAEVLLKWRPHDKSFPAECEKLCNKLFSFSSLPLKYICCCNGFPIYPLALYEKQSEGILNDISNTLTREGSTVPFSLAAPLAAQVYENQLLLNAFLSKDDFFHLLLTYPEHKTSSSFSDHALSLLTGDAFDHITLLQEEQLVDTQLFRGFFFKGDLRIIEHIGYEVDVRCLLCSVDPGSLRMLSEKKDETAQAEEARLQETFRDVYARLASNKKFNGPDAEDRDVNELSVCLTLAVKRQLLSSKVHQCAILDVRPISPVIPFLWHLSWEEVCSAGQKKGDTARTSEVAFKMTKVSVLELKASDELSKKYFPSINKIIEL